MILPLPDGLMLPLIDVERASAGRMRVPATKLRDGQRSNFAGTWSML